MNSETMSVDGATAKLYPDGPDWNGTPTATVGKFRAETPEAGSAVLRAAQAQGHRAILGPMEGDTWHSYRLVTETDGSAPFLMEPSSAPHDLAAFEAAGFQQIAAYVSARAPLVAADAPTMP
ncbi:MAG: hypothetical protein AAGL98_14925, partial [Planctomycetota bacterium]